MNTIMAIAASGMRASGKRLEASASNIANARVRGAVPATPPSDPIPGTAEEPMPYQAIEAVQKTISSGGVEASLKAVTPSYRKLHNPSAPYADSEGMVAEPDIDLGAELVNGLDAVQSYRANLAALVAADEMFQRLLDAARSKPRHDGTA